MPAYNAGKYISESIKSLQKQSHNRWELLVINDGSTDSTKEIILQFDDKRIYYFEQANKGVSAARNVGLANMRGDYFCFLDADDVLPPKSLESRIKVFGQFSDVDFVDGSVEIRNADLSNVLSTYQPSYKGNPHDLLARLDQRCFFGPSWMIRRKEGVNYQFKEGMTHGEDLLFYLSISEVGNYSYTPEVILHYRKNKGSAMSNLKGLEQGYMFFYQYVKNLFTVSTSTKSYLRRRIIRIMFLSYIRKFEPVNATRSLVRFLLA